VSTQNIDDYAQEKNNTPIGLQSVRMNWAMNGKESVYVFNTVPTGEFADPSKIDSNYIYVYYFNSTGNFSTGTAGVIGVDEVNTALSTLNVTNLNITGIQTLANDLYILDKEYGVISFTWNGTHLVNGYHQDLNIDEYTGFFVTNQGMVPDVGNNDNILLYITTNVTVLSYEWDF